MAYPKLPDYIKPPNASDMDLQNLWNEVVMELVNPEFKNRTHGSRKTYDAGCLGPICKKASREHVRRRNAGGQSERYRYLDPVISFFETQAKFAIGELEKKIVQILTK